MGGPSEVIAEVAGGSQDPMAPTAVKSQIREGSPRNGATGVLGSKNREQALPSRLGHVDLNKGATDLRVVGGGRTTLRRRGRPRP